MRQTQRNTSSFANPRSRSFGEFFNSYLGKSRNSIRPVGFPYALASTLLISGVLGFAGFFPGSLFYLFSTSILLSVCSAVCVYKIKDWKATKEYKKFVADKRIADYWSDRWSLVILTNKEANRDIADYFIQGKEAFKSDRAYIKSLSVWPAYFPGSKESNAWYAGFKTGEVESRKDKKILKRRAAVNM